VRTATHRSWKISRRERSDGANQRIILVDPLVDNNPITLQVLGICSALAVTSSLQGGDGDGRWR
jgi:hypothetical protein